jgi:hypothetical protein
VGGYSFLCVQGVLEDVAGITMYVCVFVVCSQIASLLSPSSEVADSSVHSRDPMKVVHKEQDVIVSFCLNQVCVGS